MGKVSIFQKAHAVGLDLAGRGHHVVYRTNETNRCPGCGRAHWYVGRITAECGFCGTAIVLAEASVTTGPMTRHDPIEAYNDVNWEERRQHARMETPGRTLELLVNGSPHNFALENLSAGGLMGQDPVGLAQGASLQVRFEDGTLVAAEVKWVEGDLVGLAFSTCLNGELPAA